MSPDEPNEEEQLEELPQDSQSPFSPPTPSKSSQQSPPLDDTHPTTDSNIQPEEEYDEDLSGAAEAAEPNAEDNVIDYHDPGNDTKEGDK